jgi:hypothetical protein
MAELIPPLNKQTLAKMTAGEKRIAHHLRDLLEQDYLCWYDIPVGNLRRYPDFIILHPGRGLLILEVKDWKPGNIKRITKTDVELLTDKGLITKPNPLEQVRACAYEVVNLLMRDGQLQQKDGNHKGGLIMPYGWGVIFTNVTRAQIEKGIPEEARERILPDHLVLYKDDIADELLPRLFRKNYGLCSIIVLAVN